MQEPNEFKGIRFGATQQQARSVIPSLRCDAGNAKVPPFCALEFGVGNFSMAGFLTFENAGFTTAAGSFPSEHYNDVKQAFVDKYGPPLRVETAIVKNSIGASFENESLFWRGSHATVVISRFGSDLSEGSFMVCLTAALDKESKKQDEENRKILR
jgi:hypothetical protein